MVKLWDFAQQVRRPRALYLQLCWGGKPQTGL